MLHVDYYDYFYIRQSHHELTIGHVTLQRTAPEIVALWSAICVMEMCACVTAVGGLYSYTYIYPFEGSNVGINVGVALGIVDGCLLG